EPSASSTESSKPSPSLSTANTGELLTQSTAKAVNTDANFIIKGGVLKRSQSSKRSFRRKSQRPTSKKGESAERQSRFRTKVPLYVLRGSARNPLSLRLPDVSPSLRPPSAPPRKGSHVFPSIDGR